MGVALDKILFAEPFLRKQLDNPFTKWRALTRKVPEENSTNTEPLYLSKDAVNLTLVLSLTVFLVVFALLGIATILIMLRKRPKNNEDKVIEDDSDYEEVFLEDDTSDKLNQELKQESNKEWKLQSSNPSSKKPEDKQLHQTIPVSLDVDNSKQETLQGNIRVKLTYPERLHETRVKNFALQKKVTCEKV